MLLSIPSANSSSEWGMAVMKGILDVVTILPDSIGWKQQLDNAMEDDTFRNCDHLDWGPWLYASVHAQLVPSTCAEAFMVFDIPCTLTWHGHKCIGMHWLTQTGANSYHTPCSRVIWLLALLTASGFFLSLPFFLLPQPPCTAELAQWFLPLRLPPQPKSAGESYFVTTTAMPCLFQLERVSKLWKIHSM